MRDVFAGSVWQWAMVACRRGFFVEFRCGEEERWREFSGGWLGWRRRVWFLQRELLVGNGKEGNGVGVKLLFAAEVGSVWWRSGGSKAVRKKKRIR
ncbi:hypothetical protein KY284_010849 [Solanum tuberosum]|nr:hypothetical protein KY284_010849 [Solanum tuberosum]